MTLSEEGQIRKAQVDVLVQICGAIEKLTAAIEKQTEKQTDEAVALRKEVADLATVIADVPVRDLMS